MARLLLLNSAICHIPGYYKIQSISAKKARLIYKMAKEEGKIIESYIGYPDTAAILANVVQDEIPINRGEFTWEKGDMAIVIRLKYRVKSPKEKGAFKPNPEDYEFLLIERIA